MRAFRPVTDADRVGLRDLLRRDPFTNCVVAARIESARTLSRGELGGEILVLDGDASLDAACFLGANLLPIGGDDASTQLLAATLARRRRGCTAMIGRSDTVAGIGPSIAPYWGRPRLVRWSQPLLALDRLPSVSPDPNVRPARPDELERYVPAASAMFAEELGLRPFTGAAAASLRMRIGELIHQGRALVRLDRQGRVAFKAELAAVTAATCQIQGVWVRPDLRSRGLGTAALAAVVGYGLELAPTVSLYVNDFNAPARVVYARLGMRQVGNLASVLW